MTKKRFVTNQDIKNWCGSLVQQMARHQYRPDVIVAPVRGGLTPGVMLSHYFDVPLIALPLSTRDHVTKFAAAREVIHQSLLVGNYVLVVDDINDSGTTLEQIKKFYADEELEHWVRYAVLLEKTSSKFSANFVGEEIIEDQQNEWVVFPYEDWWQR